MAFSLTRNPDLLEKFRRDCEAMGITTFKDGKQTERLDAGESAYLAKQLEYVMAETFNVEYPDLKALSLLPINTSVPPGAETYSYLQWDYIGKAQFVTDYAKDFPSSDAFVKRFNAPIASIGNSFGYTVQELRAAQAAQFGQGASLDAIRGQVARDVHARFQDVVAAFGDSARGIKGFVNHASMPDVTPVSGAWTTTLATVSDTNNGLIVADLNKLVFQPEQATKGLYKADTLVLPLSVKPRVMAPTSTLVRQPLLLNWLQNQEDIKDVFFWNLLDAADANEAAGATVLTAGVARAIAYKRDRRLLEYVVPQPFEMFPPQQENLKFNVPCHSRTGGVSFRYPLTSARMNVGA